MAKKLTLKKGTGVLFIGVVIPENYLVPSKLSLAYIADNYEELMWERDFMEEYEAKRDIERVVARNSNF